MFVAGYELGHDAEEVRYKPQAIHVPVKGACQRKAHNYLIYCPLLISPSKGVFFYDLV